MRREGVYRAMIMKKYLICTAMAACAAITYAGKPVELVNAGFEQVDKKDVPVGWSKHRNWHAERAGHNGSGGYVYECRDPKQLRGGRPFQNIKLEPGKRYHFSALVKSDGLKCERNTQGIGLYMEGWDVSNKWVFGASTKPRVSGKKSDWVKVEGITKEIPPTLARAQIQPWVNGNGIGRAIIDNVFIEEYEMVPVEGVYSDKYRREAVSGKVTFHAVLNTDLRANALADYSAAFSFVAADGTRKSANGEIVAGNHARVTMAVEDLALGTNDVVCTLALKGKNVGSAACSFARLATPTPRKVYIDEYRRTIVDGKPFFPLGMYFRYVTESNLQHYTQAPFNVLMPYKRPDRAGFDLCQKYGLKVIYNLQAGLSDKDIGKRWMTKQINEFKDHPALLAWYTNDERPLNDIPKLTARQGFVEALDRDHPTWSVQDVFTELGHYLPTYDILGMDPYPVGRKMPLDRCIYSLRQSDKDTFGIRPVWHVPQAFGWNWLHRSETKNMLCPNRQELNNMAWQAIAGGANGLVFYAYMHIVEQRATKNNDDEFTWQDVCDLAHELKRHEGVILGEPGPQAFDVPAEMAVRTWKNCGGDSAATWLLAVNCTTNPVSAAIRIQGRKERLNLDFKPMGYGMLKLEAR